MNPCEDDSNVNMTMLDEEERRLREWELIGQHELRNDDNNNGNGSGNGNLNNVGKDYHSMAGFDSFRYGVIKGTSIQTAKKK